MVQNRFVTLSKLNYDFYLKNVDNFVFDNVKIFFDENSKNTSIKNIVFATDLSDNSFATYLKLLQICKANNCIINFLYINPTSQKRFFTATFKAELKRFTSICPNKNCGIIWETTVKNITIGLKEVVDQFGGELIVTSSKYDSSIDFNQRYLSNYIICKKKL